MTDTHLCCSEKGPLLAALTFYKALQANPTAHLKEAGDTVGEWLARPKNLIKLDV